MGASVGLVLVLGHGFYNLFATDVKPPIPVLVIVTILVVLGFITARKSGEAATA